MKNKFNLNSPVVFCSVTVLAALAYATLVLSPMKKNMQHLPISENLFNFQVEEAVDSETILEINAQESIEKQVSSQAPLSIEVNSSI